MTALIINVMEVPDKDSPNGKKMLLLVDNETLITVIGFGTGEYRWKVENCSLNNPDYDPMKLLGVEAWYPELNLSVEADYFPGPATLGMALIWAEPFTFAHVVMDLINNQ